MVVSALRALLLVFALATTADSRAMKQSDEAYIGNGSRSSSNISAAATELAVENALKSAKGRRDERFTIEHLLIALLDEESALELLNSTRVDLVALRSALSAYIDSTVPKSTKDEDPTPDPQLRSVMQRAMLKSFLTNQKGVNGADYIVAVLAQDDSFASQTLRDHGLTIEVAEDENLERYLAKSAIELKELEALQSKIRVQRQSQDASDHDAAIVALGTSIRSSVSTPSSARVEVGHEVYTLRVLSEDESESVQFKAAISHDARLDLYIEETPFEVEFVASRVVGLFEAIDANARLKVQLKTEIDGEQQVVSGFGGSSGAIFRDPRSPMEQHSGRL